MGFSATGAPWKSRPHGSRPRLEFQRYQRFRPHKMSKFRRIDRNGFAPEVLFSHAASVAPLAPWPEAPQNKLRAGQRLAHRLDDVFMHQTHATTPKARRVELGHRNDRVKEDSPAPTIELAQHRFAADISRAATSVEKMQLRLRKFGLARKGTRTRDDGRP